MTPWTFSDAVNLAIDLHDSEEYHNYDLDKLTNELWQEMQRENEGGIMK